MKLDKVWTAMSLLSNPLSMASKDIENLATAEPLSVGSADLGLFEHLLKVSNVSHHDDFRNTLGRLPFGETSSQGVRRLLGLDQTLSTPIPEVWAGMSVEQRVDALMVGL